MKQSRRQELKTNELSIYLQQAYEFITRNATYIIGGVVVVVLIIVVGMLNARSRHRAELDAASRCAQLRNGDLTKDGTKLLDDAKVLVDEYATNATLGPMVLDLQASLANRLAVSLSESTQRERRLDLLKQAKGACERAITEFSKKPEVVARARMTLASIEESLLFEGASDKATIQKLYQAVIDGSPSPYQMLAKELLSNLDQRLNKLELVASRPAETAPSTRPAATSRAPAGKKAAGAESKPAAPQAKPLAEAMPGTATKPSPAKKAPIPAAQPPKAGAKAPGSPAKPGTTKPAAK